MKHEPKRLTDIIVRERSRFLSFVQRQLVGSDEAEAEDIVSEVTFNLLRKSDVISEIENLTAYFYRSLTNRITDVRRKQVPVVRIDDQREDQASPPLEVPDDNLGPQQALEQVELRERLRVAISELAPKERAVWLATEVDGRSFRDLAEEWDEPMGTLLSRKSRATAALRLLLSDYRTK